MWSYKDLSKLYLLQYEYLTFLSILSVYIKVQICRRPYFDASVVVTATPSLSNDCLAGVLDRAVHFDELTPFAVSN